MLSLLAPLRCVVCSAVVRALPFCGACAEAADRLRLPAEVALPAPAPAARAVAAYRYTGPVARAVVAGKVLGATGVWRPLGQLLGQVAVSAGVRGDVVVPVPTDRRRRRKRGIDHAAVLAREVGRALQLRARSALAVRTGLADRGAGPTDVQPLPADAVRARWRLDGQRVVLVDDVMTTGATATASATTLLRAGAQQIVVVVLACASVRPTGSFDDRSELLCRGQPLVATVDEPVDREPRTARDLPVDQGHKEA